MNLQTADDRPRSSPFGTPATVPEAGSTYPDDPRDHPGPELQPDPSKG